MVEEQLLSRLPPVPLRFDRSYGNNLVESEIKNMLDEGVRIINR